LVFVGFCILLVLVGVSTSDNGEGDELKLRSYECGFCELVMYTIYTYLTQNSTESEVANVVSQICDYVPTNEEAFCTSIISTYGPEIIELIVQKETPDEICIQLGFCNSTEIDSLSSLWSSFKQQTSSRNFECYVCSWMEFISAKHKQGVISMDTVLLQQEVCVAPLTPKQSCQNFVDKYSKSFVDQLVSSNSSPMCTLVCNP